MARVSARVIFVCRVVLRETLSVAWWERRLSGRTPSVISPCEMPPPPKVEALAKRAGLVLIRQRQEEASVKLQTFRLCQSLSLSGEVARRSRDGEGCLPGRTLSVAYGDSSPEGRALGKEGRSRPHSSTAGRSQPISGKLSALAKASPFRERWHGEAVTERGLPGRTLSVAYGDSSPEGRALGKEGRSRPHSSTAGRSQPISGKLFASAKASPFRERWHGEAVTERVAFRDELLPSFRFAKCQLPEGNSCPHRSMVKKSLPPYPLLTSPLCPAMMVSYQTVDGLNSWPAKQMGEKQDEREIQKKL